MEASNEWKREGKSHSAEYRKLASEYTFVSICRD